MPSEDCYDILQFSEDYTGYDGRAVWDFIHSKIAFNAGDDGQRRDAGCVESFEAVSYTHLTLPTILLV